jgi:hypothetical protein
MANDNSNGEGLFMARAAQAPRTMANRIISHLAMIHGFNQMASRPYAKFVRFRVGAAHPHHRVRSFAGGLMMTRANFTRFRAARNE